MKNKRFILYAALTAVLLLVTLPYAWEIIKILFLKDVGIIRQMQLYQWAACGALAYVIVQHFATKNLHWIETFSHELTHILVAMIFLRKVHSFKANEADGLVTTSGTHTYGLIPQALAPYCLPIFTYMLLALRCLVQPEGLWIFDILVGSTIAFHVLCFVRQTGNHQTDINQYPLYFSYLYIVTMQLVNLCIILVAFFPDYNVFTSVWRMATFVFENTMSYF